MLNFFKKETETPIKKSLVNLIKPVFPWIYPDNKAHKFISYETFRSWNYYAIDVISQELASTQINLFRKTQNGDEPIESHPALTLIENPNNFQSKLEFWWRVHAFQNASGEAPLLFNKERNPTNMILLNPDQLNAKANSDQFSKIESWEYYAEDGKAIPLKSEEIELLKYPNILTPFRGQGITKYIAQTLDLDRYTETLLEKYFLNNANLGLVLETDQTLSEEDVNRLKTQLNAKHQGHNKAYRTAVFSNGLSAKRTMPNMSEIQMTQQLDGLRDKILAAYRVPKAVLGITDDVRANTDVADRTFARRCLKPRLDIFVEELTKFVLPHFSGTENMYFWYENPVKEDEKLNAEINQVYINTGVKTVNEVREELGLEPLEEQPEEPEQPEEQTEPEDEEEDELDRAFNEVVRSIIIKKATEQDKRKFDREKRKLTDKLEKNASKEFEKYYDGLIERVVDTAQTKQVIESEDGQISFDELPESEKLRQLIIPIYEEALSKQSKLAYALAGIDQAIPINDDFFSKFVKNESKKFADEVTTTNQGKFRKVFEEWTKDGGTIRELKEKLRKEVKDYTKSQIETLTRTEIQRAAGFASQEVYRRTGAIGKEWFTAEDERVCQFCNPMNGVIIPINRTFWPKNSEMTGDNWGKMKLNYESVRHNPLHPRCRCTLLPIYDEAEMPVNPFIYREESQARATLRDEIEGAKELKAKTEKELKEVEELKKEYEEKEKTLIDKESKAVKKLEDKAKELKKKEKEIKKQIEEIKELNNI